MIMLRHDEKGEITQVFLQISTFTFEEFSKRYEEMGIPHVLYDADSIDMASFYVKDGAVVPKPELVVEGAYRPIKADGVDTLSFSITPQTFSVAVMFEGKIVHQESVTDGDVSFVTDHPGVYTIEVTPPFPYRGASISIEAQP